MADAKKSILFIEDDKFISEMYTRKLRQSGYDVDEAMDGPSGIEKALAKEYDLILLDIFLPNKTGIEVLNELRGPEGAGLPNTKIVIITNYAQDDESRAALESKADGYIIKADVTPKKLVTLVDQVLAK